MSSEYCPLISAFVVSTDEDVFLSLCFSDMGRDDDSNDKVMRANGHEELHAVSNPRNWLQDETLSSNRLAEHPQTSISGALLFCSQDRLWAGLYSNHTIQSSQSQEGKFH
jgi:hypothetical protein